MRSFNVFTPTPASGNYPNLNLRDSRYRKGDFIIHFWPLARRVAEIREAMEQYRQLALARDASPLARLRHLATSAARIGRHHIAR